MLQNIPDEYSASEPLTTSQKRLWAIFALALISAFFLAPFGTAKLLVCLITIFYLVSTAYRFILVAASLRSEPPKEHLPARVPDADCPIYSILIPMYKEPETFGQMLRALKALDYPLDKLDVQFLLEEDDAETRAAANSAAELFPPTFRVTIIPPSFPRTKPKACNVGLAQAKGEFLVIYDAEDRPESAQLRLALDAFRAAPPEVVCMQSCLNYYNPKRNLLTRWFTAEYSSWFDLCLPGLAALGAVIPLGGTSNHFRMDALEKLGGWDPYNVTEDCDLGVRLARLGMKTRMIASTTWEEACCSLRYWIRQRTRWQKGYIQTWFVHTRRPLKLVREIGIVGAFHFHIMIAGSIFAALINPLFWTMAILWFIKSPATISALYSGPVFAMGAFCLFVGNFFFIYVSLLGCWRRGFDSLMLPALLTPIYWALMSISAWRALIQFLFDPFTWEKTKHGLS